MANWRIAFMWIQARWSGPERNQLVVNANDQDWISSVRSGVYWKKHYAQEGFDDLMRMERWTCADDVGEHLVQ
ncbi:MAG: hypothetical protein AAF098_17415 [Pseudomonadota bacterium]